MLEIGGYIELDNYRLPMLHKDALALNCGRNCLAYLIKLKEIKRIHLPYYICDSVIDVCIRENVDIVFYHIGKDFLPWDYNIDQGDWLYIVNFFGQLNGVDMKKLNQKYGNIIVDNAQAYFDDPVDDIDTIYTCRKFFGVPDGAFLYTESTLNEEFEVDISYQRMGYLLGRFEKKASEFYEEYVNNNDLFIHEPIKRMSKLTNNLLHGIDYEFVKQKRTENYCFYHERLKDINKLQLREVEGAFAYPLYVEDGERIRKKLIENKIYIPVLWPNVLKTVGENDLEFRFAKNILPLPVDQRYDTKDLERVVEEIKSFMEGI